MGGSIQYDKRRRRHYIAVYWQGRHHKIWENPHTGEKLYDKRQKKGKQPLFSYKTLVIKPTGKQQKSIPKHLWENRIHLCRGHFKTYTEDAPLFGKYAGRYWWQPSVRGRNKKGVVMKDYEVRSASVPGGSDD